MRIGAYAPPSPWQGMGAVDDLEAVLDRRIDIVHTFKAWGAPWGRFRRQTRLELTLTGDAHRLPLVTWEPWQPGKGTEQPRYRLSAIADGRFDDYIAAWADGLREYGLPVYLRPMHEMNGGWYPWGGGVNGNSADAYVAAWRYLHAAFRDRGAGNVRWVWAANVTDTPGAEPWEAMYPGDDVVDVLGIDGYNWGTGPQGADGPGDDGPREWIGVADLFGKPYSRIARLGPQPIWITEVACADEGGDKAEWLTDLFTASLGDRLDAVVLFDERKERDWRVASQPHMREELAAARARRREAPVSFASPAGRTPMTTSTDSPHAATAGSGSAGSGSGLRPAPATINSLLLASDDPSALADWYATVFDVPLIPTPGPSADTESAESEPAGAESADTESADAGEADSDDADAKDGALDSAGAGYGLLDLGGFYVMFDKRDDVSGPNPNGARILLNVEVADPHAVAARLDDLGATWVSPLEDRGGNLFGTVADPDGNWLQIVRLSDDEEVAMGDPTSAFSGFAVRDLDEAAAFYRDVLGMRVLSLPMGILRIAINGRTSVIAYPKADHEPASFTILNIPVVDLDAAVDELAGKRVEFLRYDGFDQDERGIARGIGGNGPDIAWFSDPSGNVIAVMSSR
ncbi:hypothetical protein GCM10009624_16100 [Gordonia sinesedis]